MSRIAEIFLLADDASEVMRPLTTMGYDERLANKVFAPIRGVGEGAWAVEFISAYCWTPLFPILESLPWPRPSSVQLLIHDEEDDCCGLWMLAADGHFAEVPLPGADRDGPPMPTDGGHPTSNIVLYRNSRMADPPPLPAWTPLSGPARVILLFRFDRELATQLTSEDPGRPFPGAFTDIEEQHGGTLAYGVATTFAGGEDWSGLMPYLELLPWSYPESVQVLIKTPGDERYALWMLVNERFAQVPLPPT